MTGIFEHIAAFDDSARIASRKAVAVAQKRVADSFGAFLANAGGSADRAARLALIQDQINEVVASVVDEYGGDVEKVKTVIADWAKLDRGADGRWTSPAAQEETSGDGDIDIDSEMSEAPSAVGSEALSSHQGGSPYGPQDVPANAEATQNLEQKNEFKDQQRRGPAYEVIPATPQHCDELNNCGALQLKQGIPLYTVLKNGRPHAMFDESGQTIDRSNLAPPEGDPAYDLAAPYQARMAGGEHLKEFQFKPKGEEDEEDDGADEEAETENPKSGRVAADPPSGAGGANKREKLPKADESALGAPSPKIDKGNSGDVGGWSLDDIDTQMSGSPHETVDQDITEKTDRNGTDFLDQTDSVTKSEELPSANDSGQSTERNVEQPKTNTWSTNDGQTNPVTSQIRPGGYTAQRIQAALSAQDFVMLADAIATAPGDQQSLAQHFATYLARTNPNFDAERFIAAAVGQPTSGRDTFHPPEGTDPQLGMQAAAQDPEKNPIMEIMDSQVGAAVAAYEQGEHYE